MLQSHVPKAHTTTLHKTNACLVLLAHTGNNTHNNVSHVLQVHFITQHHSSALLAHQAPHTMQHLKDVFQIPSKPALLVATGAIVSTAVLPVHKTPIGMKMDILVCLAHQASFSMFRQSNAKDQTTEIQMEQMVAQDAQAQLHSGMVINVLPVSYQSIGTTILLYAKTVRLHNIMMFQEKHVFNALKDLYLTSTSTYVFHILLPIQTQILTQILTQIRTQIRTQMEIAHQQLLSGMAITV